MVFFQSIISSWAGYKKIRGLPKSEIEIVFFSEGNAYHRFLLPVMRQLTCNYQQKIFYITSDPNDFLLKSKEANIEAIFVGWQLALALTFLHINAEVFVMTMPDLDVFHLKRSRGTTHYVYLQHSLVSTHMVYKPKAFDNYDSIFCAGPHQIQEIREWERICQLKKKKLYMHGYAPLDEIISHKKSEKKHSNKSRKTNVLLAPSWGSHGFLENGSIELIDSLLSRDYSVTLRTHPQSWKKSPTTIRKINSVFYTHSSFKFDNHLSTYDSLIEADVMISDWSGVAFEFALGLERPVIFINVPKKVNNEQFHELKNKPIEILARNTLGVVVEPDDILKIADMIPKLISKSFFEKDAIKKYREKNVFNLGKSAEIGAKLLHEILQNELQKYD